MKDLKTQVRSYHRELEESLESLQTLRTALTNPSIDPYRQSTNSHQQPSNEHKYSLIVSEIRSVLGKVKVAEQDLLRQSLASGTDPREVASVERLRAITNDLEQRYQFLSKSIRQALADQDKQNLIRRGSSDRPKSTEGLDEESLVMMEQNVLDSTVLIVSESVLQARGTIESLRTQKNKFQNISKTIKKMTKKVTKNQVIIKAIQRLQLKQQLILIFTFFLCTALTILYATRTLRTA